MKPIIKKIFFWSAALFTSLVVIAFVADVFIMPWYVESKEVVVPNLIGKSKLEAEDLIVKSGLNPIIEGPRYSDDIPIDHVLFQNPSAGSVVKENRRIYIVISGGNPLTKMPNLIDKTLRDGTVIIERLGFTLGDITEVKSEAKPGTIVEQYPKEGTNLQKGTKIEFKISVGPNIGMVRVPDLLGLSLSEAKSIIQSNSLVVGKINYQVGNSLLPNTVLTQYPSKNKLVKVGETIDLFITKSQ